MKKTLLLIFFSFVISFGIFFVTIQIFYHEQQNALIADEKNYYDSIQEVEKKIFLVGGSHISSLNPFFIENYLANNGEKYDVYNLSKMANRPQRELSNIDLLISAEPTIVVYGISARDFSEIQSVNESISKTDQPLPDPSMFLKDWLNNQNSEIFLLQSDFSPKFISLKQLRGVAVDSQDYVKAPFFRFDYKRDFNVMSDDELKTLAISNSKPVEIRPPEENKDLLALQKIISKLEENNIKVILFTTPQHKYFYDLVEPSEKINFDQIITHIHENYGIMAYSFTDKYSDLEIWRNPTHIVVSDSASIFSEDIANIILKELP